MLRVKRMCVPTGNPFAEKVWRESRARGLATMIAWHRRSAHPAAKAQTKRIILEDIIPECGWPKMSWLKRRVREKQAEIAANLEDWGRM